MKVYRSFTEITEVEAMSDMQPVNKANYNKHSYSNT